MLQLDFVYFFLALLWAILSFMLFYFVFYIFCILMFYKNMRVRYWFEKSINKEILEKRKSLWILNSNEKRNRYTIYRRRFVSKRFIIKTYYKLSLNNEQKVEFDENFKNLWQDLGKFRKEKLQKLEFLRNLTFLSGLYSVYVSGVYFHFIFSFWGVCSLSISIVLSYYLYFKQKSYINNYDLTHCNPGPLVRKAGMSKVAATTLGTVTVASTIGLINGCDALYAGITGESALTQFGKYTGLHKDSPYKNIKK